MSNDESSGEEDTQQPKNKTKVFDKTQTVIPDTQKSASNKTVIVKDSQSQRRPRVEDESQEQVDLAHVDTDVDMAKMVARRHLDKNAKKDSRVELDITPIMTRRRREKEAEYSYIDESLLNEGAGRARKSSHKSDKYKLSSTANTSNQLQVTFNNERDKSQYDEEDIQIRRLKRSSSKREKEPEPVEQVPSVSPAKKAFEYVFFFYLWLGMLALYLFEDKWLLWPLLFSTIKYMIF